MGHRIVIGVEVSFQCWCHIVMLKGRTTVKAIPCVTADKLVHKKILLRPYENTCVFRGF